MEDVNKYADMAQALVTAYGLKIIAAIVIFVIGKWLARVLSRSVGKAMNRAKADQVLVKFVVNLAYAALLAFVVLAALAQLGIQTTSFIAIIGAAGLAIGLALQGSLSNFAAGVMLIIFRPFKVGDYIEAAGTAGSVEEIMIFSTKLKSPDNKQLYIPNGSIIAGTIVNYSAKEQRRVDLVFGCGYGDDIKKAKALLEAIVKENPLVLDEPAPTIGRAGARRQQCQFRRAPVGRDVRLLGRPLPDYGGSETALRRGRYQHPVSSARRASDQQRGGLTLP